MRGLIGEALNGIPFRNHTALFQVSGREERVRVGGSLVPLPDDSTLALVSMEEDRDGAPA